MIKEIVSLVKANQDKLIDVPVTPMGVAWEVIKFFTCRHPFIVTALLLVITSIVVSPLLILYLLVT